MAGDSPPCFLKVYWEDGAQIARDPDCDCDRVGAIAWMDEKIQNIN